MSKLLKVLAVLAWLLPGLWCFWITLHLYSILWGTGAAIGAFLVPLSVLTTPFIVHDITGMWSWIYIGWMIFSVLVPIMLYLVAGMLEEYSFKKRLDIK